MTLVITCKSCSKKDPQTVIGLKHFHRLYKTSVFVCPHVIAFEDKMKRYWVVKK